MTRRSFPGIVAALVAACCLGASTPLPDGSAEQPGWARGAVLYAAVEGLRGDGFAGVEAQLPDLKALGINAILLWPPVAVRAEGEEYAIVSESGVDPSWGSPDDLHQLVDRAHELGLRVLIDVVLNHTSDQHPRFVAAARDGPGSESWDDFDRDADGNPTHYFDWDHLPNLNLARNEVREWLIDTTVSWISTYRLDGARLDAAWALADRRPGFLGELANAVLAANPEALLIAEAGPRDPAIESGIHVAYDWTDELGMWAWDTAAASGDPATTARLLASAIQDAPNSGSVASPLVLRAINTNDSGPRMIDRVGLEKLRLLAAVQLTVPGMPMLFAGDEVGASYEPYEDRANVAWNDPHELRAWYAALIGLRSEQPALVGDDLVVLDAPAGVLAYVRGGASGESAIVVINFGAAADVELALSATPGGDLEDRLGGQAVQLRGRNVTVEMAARSAAVLVIDRP